MNTFEKINLEGRNIFFSTNVDSQKAVILLHGATSSAEDWVSPRTNISSFTELCIKNGFLTIIPDSGKMCFGKKIWDERVDSKDVLFLSKIISFIGRKTISLVGVSNGGIIATRLALEFPNLCKNLVVYSGCHPDSTSLNIICKRSFNSGVFPYIPSSFPRTLIVHGSKDTIIPYMTTFSHSLNLRKIQNMTILSKNDGHFWNPVYNEQILHWIK